jgi:hypothetical protein
MPLKLLAPRVKLSLRLQEQQPVVSVAVVSAVLVTIDWEVAVVGSVVLSVVPMV